MKHSLEMRVQSEFSSFLDFVMVYINQMRSDIAIIEMDMLTKAFPMLMLLCFLKFTSVEE